MICLGLGPLAFCLSSLKAMSVGLRIYQPYPLQGYKTLPHLKMAVLSILFNFIRRFSSQKSGECERLPYYLYAQIPLWTAAVVPARFHLWVKYICLKIICIQKDCVQKTPKKQALSKNNRYILTWIPSHIGIHRDERADKAVKKNS